MEGKQLNIATALAKDEELFHIVLWKCPCCKQSSLSLVPDGQIVRIEKLFKLIGRRYIILGQVTKQKGY